VPLPPGQLAIAWQRTEDELTATIVVPAGVEGVFALPDGTEKQLQTGNNRIAVPTALMAVPETIRPALTNPCN
jgi:hypothetical protein